MSSVSLRTIVLLLIAFMLSLSVGNAQSTSSASGWDRVPAILQRIVPPTFPNREFVVTSYGAVGDGTTDCTQAFARAIAACNAAGGGRVVVPKGVYWTGAIHLKSNVDLHVSAEAVVRFSTDPANYLPIVYTRWEGVECLNYSPLIYAFEQENIAVTGEGVLDGQASDENWWAWKGSTDAAKPNQKKARARLNDMGQQNVPVAQRVFGEGSYLRPNFFQPYRCTNVLVEGVTFKNAPMWFLHPVLCRNVTFRGVKTDGLGPNNDGIDPESCTDVLIVGCSFNNGDDCIAIKSGRNNDGRRVNMPSQSIVIRGSTMREGHGGVSIGSEISGGVRDVFIEDCTMDSPHLDRALRIKTNAMRGGVVERVFMRNIRVGQVAEAAVKIDFLYEEGENGPFLPVVRDVEVRNLECTQSEFAVWIRAFDRSPATNVAIEHCTFARVAQANVLENVRNLTLVDVKISMDPTHEKK